MQPDYAWLIKRWFRQHTGLVSCLSLMLAFSGIVTLFLASPAVISAAFATADPTPKVNVVRSGDPQQFVDNTRSSVDEIWNILSTYAGTLPPSAAFPRLIVASTVTDTECILIDPDSPKQFDPESDLADTCMNGKFVYLSQSHLSAYAQKLGVGQLLGYLVEHLASFKATSDSRHFTACFTGAWTGYLEYHRMLSQQLVSEVQAYFTPDRLASFDSGRSNRSIKPCLT